MMHVVKSQILIYTTQDLTSLDTVKTSCGSPSPSAELRCKHFLVITGLSRCHRTGCLLGCVVL